MSSITAASSRKLATLRHPLLSMSEAEALQFTISLRARRQRPVAPLRASTRTRKGKPNDISTKETGTASEDAAS